MKLSRAIKKVAALGAGAAMMGATILGATAADLKNYPSPFVKDGKFNALIVVGDSAASSDVLGSVDIATSLQYAAKVKKTASLGAGGQISAVGDSKKIEQSTNKLELNESLTSTGITSVTGNDISALKAGSLSNEYGTFTYTQYIDLFSAQVRFEDDATDNTDSDDVPRDYLVFPTTNASYKYVLTFTPAIKSDNDANDDLEDIKKKKLKLLGKEYTILGADHDATWRIKLTLMGGAVTDILAEGETKTYTIKGKNYDVTLDFVGSTTAKFTVNNEASDSLLESATHRFTDGTEVGVIDILSQSFSGGVRKVEFSVGAEKVVIEDTGTAAANSTAGTLQVGTNTIDGVRADIKSSADGGIADNVDVYISGLEVNYTPSSDTLYVKSGSTGSKAAEVAEGESGNFFLNGFDIQYGGLEKGNTEEITLKPSGNNNYKLKFKNKGGYAIGQDVFGYNGSNIFRGSWESEEMRNLTTTTDGQVIKNSYAVIGDGTTEGYGTIVQYKGLTASDDIFKIKDVGSGKTHDISYDSTGSAKLTLDGYTTTVQGKDASGNNGADNATSVIFDTAKQFIYTQYGARIYFGAKSSLAQTDGINFTIRSEVMEDKTSRDQMTVNVYYDTTNSQLQMNDSTTVNPAGLRWYQIGDETKYEGYGRYGLYSYFSKPTTGQREQKWVYPDNQITTAVFVTSGDVAFSQVSAGGESVLTYYETTPIEVGAAVLASEVANVKAQNVILVGGPCANSAAAEIMGVTSANCVEGFTEGKAKLKLYENTGNVALLVAGYSAMDTRRAARVMANYEDWQTKAKLTGTEVEVAGTSFTDITVSAPVAAVAAPVATTNATNTT